MMTISRKSEKSGTITTKDLAVTQEQMDQFTSGKGLIQNIFPNLTPYERDWLKFGFTEEEWKELYGAEEEPRNPPSLEMGTTYLLDAEHSKVYRKDEDGNITDITA